MKRFAAVLLTLLFSFNFAACGNSTGQKRYRTILKRGYSELD